MAINHRTAAKPGHKRYEELAEEIARQIAANVLRPGDRLPSIRQTCRTLPPEPVNRVPGL
jgi:DNA-binding FadR family transcriptional regulator